jgi:ParB family transcriptional regulator, chromosome partitioning protein
MAKTNKGGLGRGLKALLQDDELDIRADNQLIALGDIAQIPVGQIQANPFQPRTHFEEESLAELAESIRIHGIIQPVTLRKMGYENYQLISGERRTRAAILAGLSTIPAYIRLADDQSMLEMALIENIQRENLNAIEIALSYQRLMDECNLKQEELGERVGKDRSTVSNYVRLLGLPDEIQAAIKNGELSMGHARSIAGIKDENEQLALYHRIVQESLSVRATENIIKNNQPAADKKTTSTPPNENSIRWEETFNRSKQNLAYNTSLKCKSNGTATLTIVINNDNDLDSLLEKLSS